MNDAVHIIGILVAILVAKLLFGWIATMSMRLRVPLASIRTRADMPKVILDSLERGAQFLEKQGFEASHVQSALSVLANITDPIWTLVYYHPVERCYAKLAPAPNANAVWPHSINFVAMHPDGSLLQTMSRAAYGVVPGYEGYLLNDPFTADDESQWRSHREAVGDAEARDSRWSLRARQSPERLIELGNRFDQGYFDFLVEHGHAVAQSGIYHFRPWTALWFSRRLLKGDRKAAALQKKTFAAMGAPVGQALVSTQVASYARAEQAQSSHLGGLGKLAVFVASALAFGMAFGFAISFDYMIALFAVLLFHELGHIAGMRLFGYRDLQILFLPFLGAAAIGNKPRARAVERAIIYLLGPVPGLLLGCLYFVAGDHLMASFPWLASDRAHLVAFLLVAVNYTNLLPFLPFDGGQLLNAAVFDRSPRLRFAFASISMLAMAAGAAWLADPVLGAIAVFIAIGLHQQYQEMSTLLALRREGLTGAVVERETALAKIFACLNRNGAGQLTFAVQFQKAKAVLERIENPLASFSESVVTLGLYASLVLVPPLAIASSLPAEQDDYEALRRYSEMRARQCFSWYATLEANDCPASDSLAASPHIGDRL